MLRTWLVGSTVGSVLVGGLWVGVSAPDRAGQAAPQWNIDPVSGYPIQRDACLSIKVGSAAATDCGDLRVTHALPAVRVYNTEIAPTLLYNSEYAHPHITIPLKITQQSTTTTPDSVEVQVLVGPAPGPTVVRATKR